jgi:hypothetical protein
MAVTQFDLLCVLEDARKEGEGWIPVCEIKERVGENGRNVYHKLSKLLVFSHVERRLAKGNGRAWEYRARRKR